MIRLGFILFLLPFNLLAFPCYVTIAKDSCWQNFNVTISVQDVINNNQNLIKVNIPKETSWKRETFNCQTNQELKFVAQFSPVFWEEDKDKSYDGIHFWFLPAKITPLETAWNINVCFPKDFSEVPMPPDATANCTCDFNAIPKVSPVKP